MNSPSRLLGVCSTCQACKSQAKAIERDLIYLEKVVGGELHETSQNDAGGVLIIGLPFRRVKLSSQSAHSHVPARGTKIVDTLTSG